MHELHILLVRVPLRFCIESIIVVTFLRSTFVEFAWEIVRLFDDYWLTLGSLMGALVVSEERV